MKVYSNRNYIGPVLLKKKNNPKERRGLPQTVEGSTTRFRTGLERSKKGLRNPSKMKGLQLKGRDSLGSWDRRQFSTVQNIGRWRRRGGMFTAEDEIANNEAHGGGSRDRVVGKSLVSYPRTRKKRRVCYLKRSRGNEKEGNWDADSTRSLRRTGKVSGTVGAGRGECLCRTIPGFTEKSWGHLTKRAIAWNHAP